MKEFELQCPVPFVNNEKITLAHGGGGKRSTELIENIILPYFENGEMENIHDGALLNLKKGKIAFSTDSFVVTPHFFPGGDIGELAIYGTVNDVAVCGAKPEFISCSFILEEGFLMEDFRRIVESMSKAAEKAGVSLVTGDTKVVGKGKGDGIYINTTGIGTLIDGAQIDPRSVLPGDSVIINGTVGDHGMTIMSQREGLSMKGDLKSDTKPLHTEVASLIEQFGADIHCIRDMTRGGLASTMHEIAKTSEVSLELNEHEIPVSDPVKGACAILGLDPLHVANEGKIALFCDSRIENDVLRLLSELDPENKPTVIGHAKEYDGVRVSLKGILGGNRILEMLSGEQLPRIC